MSRRGRLAIAAQGVAVAVLVALVYVTLLQPDDGGDLSGVEAPGGGRAQVQAPDADGKRADGRRADVRGGPAGAAAGGRGSADGVGGPYRYWWHDGRGTTTTGGLVSTPSDHQYGDAVGELLKRVGD